MITPLSDREIQITAPIKLLYQAAMPYVNMSTTGTLTLNDDITNYDMILLLFCNSQQSNSSTANCELKKQEQWLPPVPGLTFLLKTYVNTDVIVGKRVLKFSDTNPNVIESLYVGQNQSVTAGNSTWDKYGVITEIYGLKGVSI